MTHSRLYLAAAIIAVVVVGSFLLSVPRAYDGESPVVSETERVPTVALRDVFKKDTHTISGTLEAPNECTTVEATASLRDGGEAILLALTTTGSEEVCLERPTERRFSTSVAAPEALPIVVTVNGAVATTTSL